MKNIPELPCAIVEDLLPAYMEGLTSEETTAAVEAHLASCPACAAKRAAMGAEEEPAVEQTETAREVVYLRAFGGLSFREIGDVLGRTETWARVTFYRGKETLRKGDESHEEHS